MQSSVCFGGDVVTLIVFKKSPVLRAGAWTWVFENVNAALFAAAELPGEAWFLVKGAYVDAQEASRAAAGGRLVASLSSLARRRIPMAGPSIRKCGLVRESASGRPQLMTRQA